MSQVEAGALGSADTSGAAIREGLFGTTPTTSAAGDSVATTSSAELAAGFGLFGTTTETPEPTTARTTVLPYSSVIGGEGTIGAATTATPEPARNSDAEATVKSSTTALFALPYEKVVAPLAETANATKTPSTDTGSSGNRDDLFTHNPERAENGFTDFAETNPITPPLGPQKETSLGPLGTRDMLRAMQAPTLGDSIAAGSDIGIATPPLLTKAEEKTLLGEVRTIPIPTIIEEADAPQRMQAPASARRAVDTEAREEVRKGCRDLVNLNLECADVVHPEDAG
jgi:hypothetical protein